MDSLTVEEAEQLISAYNDLIEDAKQLLLVDSDMPMESTVL